MTNAAAESFFVLSDAVGEGLEAGEIGRRTGGSEKGDAVRGVLAGTTGGRCR
jgi:hypothetical protein